MKKPYKYDELSSVKCTHRGCSKRIKKKLVERKANTPRFCFKHFVKPVSNPSRSSLRKLGA